MWSGRKKLATSSALIIASATGYCVSDEQRRRKAELTALSAYRIGNLLSTVTTICADYGFQYYVRREAKTNLLEQREEELLVVQHNMETYSVDLLNVPEDVRLQRSPIEEEALRTKIAATRVRMDNLAQEISELLEAGVRKNHDIHTRNAIRLTNMCAENGGLYIKLGQHIAMLDYIVPSEYRTELTRLLGSTPNSSIDSVRRVIRAELGDYPENLFDSFDPVPIASASLAQVHVAYKDGKKYAVKVQHEGLKESATVDTWVITNIVALVHRLFEEFDYVWLTKEMNRNLPLELNFQFEKLNIQKAASVLKDYIRRGEVAVPVVNEALTAQQVLTMSFEEGCYITNSRQISEWGLSRTQIGSTIAHVFCDLIFRHGFVHCGEFFSVHVVMIDMCWSVSCAQWHDGS
jgi:predicted unusual protein kinase regulating ubiquinone biosynthesis (AarF/ABC1/UbiB family)